MYLNVIYTITIYFWAVLPCVSHYSLCSHLDIIADMDELAHSLYLPHIFNI